MTKIVQDLSVKLYQQAQEAQAQAGTDTTAEGNAEKNDDDNTVEGDFKEVDPDDKK